VTAAAGLASPSRYSYGSTAAVVTSVGLIVGFGAASVSKSTVVSGLLIIAVADNLSDSLSIHIYQESENLEAPAAFRATLTNFAARFLVVMSFVGIVIAFRGRASQAVATVWGMLLLGCSHTSFRAYAGCGRGGRSRSTWSSRSWS
jgi:vacuolar iron transporter family protein